MNVKNILLLLIISIVFPSFSQDPSAEEIINKVNDLVNVESSYAKANMTITTTSGIQRTFLYESWSKNKGEKNLVRYLEPSRVKGEAILMLNHSDDIWMFFPRTQRVRKLATHAKKQKMQGGDFSYEDMGSGDAFIKDYIPKRLEDDEMEGYDCYKLELIKKPEGDMSYSRLVLWAIKENFFPVVIDYYGGDEPTFVEKRLVQSDIQLIDQIPTAMKAVMLNRIDNTQTSMEFLDVQYDVELEENMFTERALKK